MYADFSFVDSNNHVCDNYRRSSSVPAVCRYLRWIFAHAKGHRELAVQHSLLPLTNFHFLDFDNPPTHLQQVVMWIVLVIMLAGDLAPVKAWVKLQLENRIVTPEED